MRHFRRFKQITFRDKLQPVRNKIVNRAFPRAVGITTPKATIGLAGCRFRVELAVNFLVHLYTYIGLDFAWVLARNIDKLEYVTHLALPVLAVGYDLHRMEKP